MRIVSLDPGATAILRAIGLAAEVVGIADDPSPGDAAELGSGPFVARATRTPDGRRRLEVDGHALAAAGADLVVAPPGVTLDPGAVGPATVITHDPSSLEGVFHAIATIGAMTASEDAALGLVEELRDQLGGIEERVRERVAEGLVPLRVVVLEWFDPPWTAGRWIPEQVRRAGGWEVLGSEGEPSRPTSWEAIAEIDPEAIFLLCRGEGLRAAMRAFERLERPDGWDELEAVQRGQVFAVDARTYFTEAGPDLVEGIALVAELLDPEGHVGIAPDAGWAPLA